MKKKDSGMPIEKGLRPTSPVHVHVDDDIPVHVHVKQKTKKGTKKVVSSAANVRGKSGKRSVSAKSRSKSPSGPWVPAPGRATKGQKLPWQWHPAYCHCVSPRRGTNNRPLSRQGPTERVEIPTQDLSTDEEEVVHGQMRNYERKIETLMSEMGSLKNEVEVQKGRRELEKKEELLETSRHVMDQQERELEDTKDVLNLAEHENKILRKSVELLSEEADINRRDVTVLSAEREKLMKKLIEVEMDGQAAVKQIGELRDALRRMREENRVSSTDTNRWLKQKDILLEKLSDFESTNRTLRRLLREQHQAEVAAVRMGEQRDQLIRKLADSDRYNERLRIELSDRDHLISELRSQIIVQKDENLALSGLQSSIENTRAHLQKQLRTKEADLNRMAVQIRTLESARAQDKIEIEHLQELVSRAKEKADRDKDALKKATRVQKQRAERSQDALEKLNSQLLEREAQLEDLRSQLDLMGPRYDKMSKEKSQMLAENSALKTRLEELETLMDRVENSSKVHQENVALQLHDKQSEISGLHSENERLKYMRDECHAELKTTTQKLLEMKVREDALAKTLTQRADEFENTNQFVKEIQKEIDSVIEITNSELDEKQEQIICLSTKLTDTQSKLDTSMSCLKSLQREVEDMKSSKDEDIAEKERQVKVLVSQLSEKQKELDQSLDNNSLQRMSCSCVSAEKSGTHSSAESIQKEKNNPNPNNRDNDDLVMKLKEKECEIASLKMSNDQLKVILEEAHKGIRSFQSISSPQKDADDSFSNREISVLKTEIEILKAIMDQTKENAKEQHVQLSTEMQKKLEEISALSTERDQLKASIHSVETKLHTADEELVQLRGNLKQYENLVEEYKAQMNRSRREADDTVVQLEEAKKHNERLQHEGEFELEKVKVRLHQRLQELEPLPDMLKSTELRLFESQERMLAYEKKNVENTKLIAELTAKVEHVTEQLDQMRNKYHESQDDNKMLQTKLDGLDRKCRDFEDQNRDIMNNLAKREEALHQTGLRLEEKSRENAGLTRQLENALSDIRRQTEQTRDKASQKERTYQTRISDLESQMSQLRAEMARVKREKEENERKFNSRLYDLKDRLEQSHSTNRSMQNYVQFLKNSYANVFGDSSVSFPSTPMGPGIP